jgi:hypothetical protein
MADPFNRNAIGVRAANRRLEARPNSASSELRGRFKPCTSAPRTPLALRLNARLACVLAVHRGRCEEALNRVPSARARRWRCG